MDEASGFFETPSMAQSRRQGMFELISSSPESYCEIWRADKEGRFRVYKTLKSEYVGDPVYERLLRKEFEIGYSLDNPYICEYYDFVNIPSLGNCIEMEWIDGCSLALRRIVLHALQADCTPGPKTVQHHADLQRQQCQTD